MDVLSLVLLYDVYLLTMLMLGAWAMNGISNYEIFPAQEINMMCCG